MMKELEGIVSKLESGETELDESLEMYKNGVSIIKQLNERLGQARKQIETVGEETSDNE